MTAARALLEVRGLRVWFPGRGRPIRAVDGVDFTLHRGETLGLVGESGCGKTTTARAIVGLERPRAGAILLDGVSLLPLGRRRALPLRRRIQMVFQDPQASLDPRQTIGSILEEPLVIHRLADRRRRRLLAVRAMLEVGMDPRHLNRYPHEFSGGQLQRIGIARALQLKPEVLLLDEPVSALDVSIQAQILNLLQDLKRSHGLSYLFIAHDLSVVRHLADRVAVMYLGRVVEIGPKDAVFERPKHPYTEALLSAVPIPDPVLEKRRRRILLRGDPPSPDRVPEGCAFASRCPQVTERCRRESPQLLPRTGLGPATHRVACFEA